MEMSVNPRLKWCLENNNLLATQQAGFGRLHRGPDHIPVSRRHLPRTPSKNKCCSYSMGRHTANLRHGMYWWPSCQAHDSIQYTVYSSQLFTGICIFSKIFWSNVDLPDGSNMNMARLPVSQKWCSPYIGVGSTNGEQTINSLLCIKPLIIYQLWPGEQ